MNKEHLKIKYACYASSATMSVVSLMPPVLFTTFHDLYGISYSLLGTLAVVCFITQLSIDLIFSFYSHKFSVRKTVRAMPIISIVGFLIFAIYPMLFPSSAYVGLVIGTVIFSVSAGLAEVLASPIVASLPSDKPDHEMSKLHSVYAWGSVAVSIISTLFILIFKAKNWFYLVFLLLIIPIAFFILAINADIPELTTSNEKRTSPFRNKTLWLMVVAIFLGGATECTMSQWCSSFIERALKIDKVWGDLCGVALFSLMLGFGRSLYAKYGKSIEKILLVCAGASVVCYLVAAISPYSVVGLIACALTGLTSSLLWPGTLTVAESRIPNGGVVMFALLAAGGDLGASTGPQAVGIITDYVSKNFTALAENLSLSPEQLGMKAGILFATILPLLAFIFYLIIYKTRNKTQKN